MLRLTIRALGLELLSIEITDDPDNKTDPGDCVTNPVGFVPSPGDQRWQPAPELKG